MEEKLILSAEKGEMLSKGDKSGDQFSETAVVIQSL